MKTFKQWVALVEAKLDNRDTAQMFRDAIQADGGVIGPKAKSFYKTIMNSSPEELPVIQAIVRSIQQGGSQQAQKPQAQQPPADQGTPQSTQTHAPGYSDRDVGAAYARSMRKQQQAARGQTQGPSNLDPW